MTIRVASDLATRQLVWLLPGPHARAMPVPVPAAKVSKLLGNYHG